MNRILIYISLVVETSCFCLWASAQSNDCYADPCDLPLNSVVLSSDFGLWYNFADPIAGVQLDFSGTLSGSGGGVFEMLDFYETIGNNTYLAVSLQGGVVPAGCGVLTQFSVASPNLNIFDLIVSDASASELPTELLNNGDPLACIVGCMDPEACNYLAQAAVDDGSCADEDLCGECGGDNSTCLGCTNETAMNFNPLAFIDDGSCLYTQEAVNTILSSLECLVYDGDNDGLVGTSDLLGLLTEFGAVCTPETTFSCGNAISHQGYTYETVQIDEQCWFADNLRNHLYLNGDSIQHGLTDNEWASTTEGALSVYGEGNATIVNGSGDAEANYVSYGVLYNWYAVIDERGICPSGWHIPSHDDFMSMEMALGMSESDVVYAGWRGTNEGEKLKSSSVDVPAWNGINSAGFSAVAAGTRFSWGGLANEGGAGYFWTSSSFFSETESYARRLQSDYSQIHSGPYSKSMGFSIRCIQDAE